MKIGDIMTRSVRSIEPTENIVKLAHLMGELDVGAIPVIEHGKIVGIVTDRDIAIRAVAAGLHNGTPVLRIMSRDVKSCREADEVDEVLATMSEQQVRRMPVCSAGGELVGMISIGDLARWDRDKDEVAETLSDICRPLGLHSQSLPAS